MKLFAGVAFAALIMSTALSAAPVAPTAPADADPCQSVRKGADLTACKGRQAEAAVTKPAGGAAANVRVDPLEQMKLEEEKLSKRLQRICRGC
jgi:hypothetical protein